MRAASSLNPSRQPAGRPGPGVDDHERRPAVREAGYDRAMNNRQQQGLLMVVFGVAIILVVAVVVALLLGWIKF